MQYVYVKDSEGFVFKKKASEVAANEKTISEKEYKKKSGHGGTRENAGRKTKFSSPLKFQIRVTKEEKDFLSFARDKKMDFTALMNIAMKADL